MHVPHKTPAEALRAYADHLDEQEGTEYTDRHNYLRAMANEVELLSKEAKILRDFRSGLLRNR